jgi:hypothetical protein
MMMIIIIIIIQFLWYLELGIIIHKTIWQNLAIDKIWKKKKINPHIYIFCYLL